MHYRLPGKSKRVIFSTKEYCIPKFWDENVRRVKNAIAYSIGKFMIVKIILSYYLKAENQTYILIVILLFSFQISFSKATLPYLFFCILWWLFLVKSQFLKNSLRFS